MRICQTQHAVAQHRQRIILNVIAKCKVLVIVMLLVTVKHKFAKTQNTKKEYFLFFLFIFLLNIKYAQFNVIL